jgi:hypothetical protein
VTGKDHRLFQVKILTSSRAAGNPADIPAYPP